MTPDAHRFFNEDFDVRAVLIDGEPWWIAKDACAVLGYTHTPSAIRRLDDDEYSQFTPNVRRTAGPPQRPMTIVSESGLYSLILGSHKPQAKAFKRWITHEVLPTIRKTGGVYAPPGAQAEMNLGHVKALRALADSVDAAQAVTP